VNTDQLEQLGRGELWHTAALGEIDPAVPVELTVETTNPAGERLVWSAVLDFSEATFYEPAPDVRRAAVLAELNLREAEPASEPEE
jgi:hypothetical protein